MNNDYNNQNPNQTEQSADNNQSYSENSYQQYPNNQYYQNSYGQPSYNPPPQPPQEGKGLATASMVCGIFSLVLFYMGPLSIVAAILGIIAIITAIIAKKKGFVGGMATAGLITGIIGTILSLIVFVSCVLCFSILGA